VGAQDCVLTTTHPCSVASQKNLHFCTYKNTKFSLTAEICYSSMSSGRNFIFAAVLERWVKLLCHHDCHAAEILISVVFLVFLVK